MNRACTFSALFGLLRLESALEKSEKNGPRARDFLKKEQIANRIRQKIFAEEPSRLASANFLTSLKSTDYNADLLILADQRVQKRSLFGVHFGADTSRLWRFLTEKVHARFIGTTLVRTCSLTPKLGGFERVVRGLRISRY